ncbi:RNA polymerase II-associated protein 3 [Smittium mucronatum]|uniref:RNA polymerase II-associated protein 3 n=1 Tax=Smittium mucronatum TaxID=133383 RepID=A0A1R0H0W0_9FUNG|nr:RNA polymerase II-associated protein 3 [Smittium mucronatum]
MKNNAEFEKNKGNASFKVGDYNAAILHYTNAINLLPDVPVYWTNRAMANLKLSKFQDSASDCTQALKIDPKNVKALWRRATANFNLGNLSQSKADLQKALQFDPKNKSVLDDLNKVNFKMNKLDKSQSAISVPVTKLESRNHLPSDALDLLNTMNISNPTRNNQPSSNAFQPIRREFNPSTPKSIIEFERSWKEAKASPQNVLKLLSIIQPDSLQRLFGASFEDSHLELISASLLNFLSDSNLPADYDWSFQIMNNLPQIPRFDLALSFSSSKTRNDLSEIIKILKDSGAISNDKLALLEQKF